MKRKKLTFTAVLIIACIIFYILDVFIVSPDTGYISKSVIEQYNKMINEMNDLEIAQIPMETYIPMWKIMGNYGGHIKEIFGFSINNFMQGRFWTPFTVVLTHGFLLHLVVNMLSLYFVGSKIEKEFGAAKTYLIFFSCAAIDAFIAEFICVYLLNSNISTVATGASGGIYALIGIAFMLQHYDKSFWKNNFKKPVTVYLIIYMLFTSLSSLYSLTAHAVGLILGMLISLFIHKKLETGKGMQNN